MHVAIIIGGSLVVTGAVLYLHHRLTAKGPEAESDDASIPSEESQTEECCGMHITCRKDSLSPVFEDEIEYFDDDELDRFANRKVEEYTEEEIEMFRDVLLTLRAEEIAPWARSIQLRGIELPEEVRDELFMIVSDARQAVLN